jgi:hypothetical protein
MGISSKACPVCKHRHASPPAGVDPDMECVPQNHLHDCAVWQCEPNISFSGPVVVIGDDLHGSTDCAVTGDPDCYNDGLCCHDDTSQFECPWERGEYPAWANETETKTILGSTRTDTVVSEYKRRQRESCLAHEAFDEDRLRGWLPKRTGPAPCTHPVHARYDEHLNKDSRGPLSEGLYAVLALHQPLCVNWDGDPRPRKSDVL